MKLTKNVKIALVCVSVSVMLVGTYIILDNTVYVDNDPVFFNMGIDVDSADVRSFVGFGMRDDNMSKMPNGEYQLQACFKWYVSWDTDVLVPCDGVIERIDFQPQSDDYSVLIVPEKERFLNFGKNKWVIDIDHVKDIRFERGDRVKAGEVLGRPGSDQGGGTSMFELDLKNMSDDNHYAPMKFFDPATKAAYEEKLTLMMNHLEDSKSKGRGEIYDYDHMIHSGCWMEKIPEEYYRPGNPGYPGYST